ncbi:MAG: hypothetical protein AAFX93_09140 [Verrucomicrobiota bacterium]
MLLSISAANLSGTFVNLGFESANLSNPIIDDPSFQTHDWSNAAPGWGHNTGTDADVVYYINSHLGDSQRYLIFDATNNAFTGMDPLAGNFSLLIGSGNDYTGPDLNGNLIGYEHAFISQTGMIPAQANSIQLQAIGDLAVFVDGNTIPMINLGGNLWGVDVSGFAGQTSELVIMEDGAVDSLGTLVVDDIAFSTTVVPEPMTIGYVAVTGFLVFALKAARARANAKQR